MNIKAEQIKQMNEMRDRLKRDEDRRSQRYDGAHDASDKVKQERAVQFECAVARRTTIEEVMKILGIL